MPKSASWWSRSAVYSKVMFKLFKWGGLLAAIVAGSIILVDRTPSLKANIYEAVNPRVKEQALLEKLQSNLRAMDASVAAKSLPAHYQELVDDSQNIVSEITDINDPHAGLTDGLVTKALDLMISQVASPTPGPDSASLTPPCTQ